MAILDFKEISKPYHGKPTGKNRAATKRNAPVANEDDEAVKKSTDLDAFEKFASEFLTHICGCKIIEGVARGPDGGRDLIVDGKLTDHVQGRLLISCKHKAHSGSAVLESDEINVKGRLDACGAKFFVGFYSTIASSGLRRHLEDMQRSNRETFDFYVFNSLDIESRMIAVDEPRGWLLAARHFPKSMGNLFRRFVVPINYYQLDDIRCTGNSLRLVGPYGGRRSIPTKLMASDDQKRQMVDEANDALTSDLHAVFFCDALADFIRLLPNAFAHVPGADPANLELCEVVPNFAATSADLGDGHQTTLRIVASVWSFWDAQKAVEWLLDMTIDSVDHGVKTVINAASSITIGRIAGVCDGKYRDIFARLVAFCPAHLMGIPVDVQVVRTGVRLGKDEQLAKNFGEILASLNANQLEELERYDGCRPDKQGWRELFAVLGWEEMISRLDPEIAAVLEAPPTSLGRVAQSSQIGFNRRSYNQWLEQALGLEKMQDISLARINR